MHSLPHSSQFIEEPPTKPGDAPKKWDVSQIAIDTAAAVVVSIVSFVPALILFPIVILISEGAWLQAIVIVALVSLVPSWLLFLIALGAIVYSAWQKYTTRPDRKKVHRLQTMRYEEKLLTYKSRKRTYDDEEKKANSPAKSHSGGENR